MKIENQSNEHFDLIKNDKEGCFDLILKKESYETSSDLLSIISWVHQLGKNLPSQKIRIGAKVSK